MKKATKKKKQFSSREKIIIAICAIVIASSVTAIVSRAATPSPLDNPLLVAEPGPADVTGTTADTEALGNSGVSPCCGTAAKTYSATSTSFGPISRDTFCKPPPAVKIFPPNNVNVLFPASGGTTTWRCQCNNTQNIMGEEIVGSNTTTYSDCSAKREGPGKCGPNNAKTFFSNKLYFPSFDDFVGFAARYEKEINFKLCAEGVPTRLFNFTIGGNCERFLYSCGGIVCAVNNCLLSEKGKIGHGETAFSLCGDGYLDADLGEECENKDLFAVWVAQHGRTFGVYGQFGYYMFGHRCLDKGLCGTAKCTDKCKVDYSGCYPCPPIGIDTNTNQRSAE